MVMVVFVVGAVVILYVCSVVAPLFYPASPMYTPLLPQLQTVARRTRHSMHALSQLCARCVRFVCRSLLDAQRHPLLFGALEDYSRPPPSASTSDRRSVEDAYIFKHHAVLESVARTGRLFTVDENPRALGWGAEVASIVAD